MLEQILAALKSAGVAVPPNCDPATAMRLVNEGLAAAAASLRDLRDVDLHSARLRELVEQYTTPVERLSGSRAWREQRRLEQLRSEIEIVEDGLVRALSDAYAGFVLFSPMPAARPHGEDLLALARDLRVRDARGELPLPRVGQM